MSVLKRILWVEDNQDITRARRLFPDAETKKVSTMDDAIREISSSHLYDYDTVVLDIDFENGLPKGPNFVVEELSKKIYLSKDQRNKKFLMDNGGYLLYLYLLEKGYPSDQIIFLTGNGGIIEGLKKYTQESLNHFSKDEITGLIIAAWEEAVAEDEDNIELFMDKVDELPVRSEYKTESFDYAEALLDEDEERLRKLINDVKIEAATESIKNTGDMMIYRFHEANLETPEYYSKNDNDIDGHNFSDAEKWLELHRTKNRVTRWLVLEATNYINELFKNSSMERQVASIFSSIDHDPGIQSSFRQMFYVFDGLRAEERRGAYYQALAAMLVPFDINPKSRRPIVEKPNDYENMRWTFAWFAKEARNYSAHNLFGSSISNESLLFILLGSMIAILDRDQLESMQFWVDCVKNEFFNGGYSETNNMKIEEYIRQLLSARHISVRESKMKVQSRYYSLFNEEFPEKSQPYGIVKLLGINKRMTVSVERNSSTREKYYVFCLASFIVKSFEGVTDTEITERFGCAVSAFIGIANYIVETYEYPAFEI